MPQRFARSASQRRRTSKRAARVDTLGVRLVAPVGGLIALAGYVLFRKYDVPDEVRLRVVPEPALLAPTFAVREDGARNSPSSTPAANS